MNFEDYSERRGPKRYLVLIRELDGTSNDWFDNAVRAAKFSEQESKLWRPSEVRVIDTLDKSEIVFSSCGYLTDDGKRFLEETRGRNEL